MVKRFLSLEWKQFKRASYFQKGIAIKILLFLAALYFGGIAVVLGAASFFILKEALPNIDPLQTVNNFLIYWILFDLAVRFFMQQLPVMNIKPLITIPLKRNKIIHYLLGKTGLSFFNILSVLLFLPFCIVLLAQGYTVLNVICWFFSLIFITLSVNFLNFLINKYNVVFYVTLAVLALLIGLEYYQVYKVSQPIGFAFNLLYDQPYLAVIPLIIMVGLYQINFKGIKKGFYLDGTISKKA